MLRVIDIGKYHRTKAGNVISKEIVDILKRTRALLSVPFGWNKKGVLGSAWEKTDYMDKDACSFDCLGALLRAHSDIRGRDIYRGNDVYAAPAEFELTVSYIENNVLPLMGFNDIYKLGMFEDEQEDKRTVLALLDRALEVVAQ